MSRKSFTETHAVREYGNLVPRGLGNRKKTWKTIEELVPFEHQAENMSSHQRQAIISTLSLNRLAPHEVPIMRIVNPNSSLLPQLQEHKKEPKTKKKVCLTKPIKPFTYTYEPPKLESKPIAPQALEKKSFALPEVEKHDHNNKTQQSQELSSSPVLASKVNKPFASQDEKPIFIHSHLRRNCNSELKPLAALPSSAKFLNPTSEPTSKPVFIFKGAKPIDKLPPRSVKKRRPLGIRIPVKDTMKTKSTPYHKKKLPEETKPNNHSQCSASKTSDDSFFDSEEFEMVSLSLDGRPNTLTKWRKPTQKFSLIWDKIRKESLKLVKTVSSKAVKIDRSEIYRLYFNRLRKIRLPVIWVDLSNINLSQYRKKLDERNWPSTKDLQAEKMAK